MISRIKLHEGDTEFWKRRFLGEGFDENNSQQLEVNDLELPDVLDDVETVDGVAKDVEDDEADEEEEEEEEEEEVEVEVEQTETQAEAGDRVKEKEVKAAKPLQMIGVQLLKDSDQISSSKKSRRRSKITAMV